MSRCRCYGTFSSHQQTTECHYFVKLSTILWFDWYLSQTKYWVVETLWFYQRWHQYYRSENKCPNMEFFLFRIVPRLGWIRTRKNSVFGHFPRSEGNRHSWLFLLDIRRVSSSIILALNQNAAQKMKFLIKVFFSKCGQMRNFLQISSHLVKKSLMENFIFCAVKKKIQQTKVLLNIDLVVNKLTGWKKELSGS